MLPIAVRRAVRSAPTAVPTMSHSVSARWPTVARQLASAIVASAMNWPRSMGCVNGPVTDGRNDLASMAFTSLASTEAHGPGRARFATVATRQKTITTVPPRTATVKCLSAQSTWATAHAKIIPLPRTNAPVR